MRMVSPNYICGKIPEAVIQKDQQLLMWYNFSRTRVGED